MVLWWRMVQLELPLWSQSSTTSHTPIHYPQCRSSPLSCWLSRWPCNTSARYQSLPSPLLSAATLRRRWQPSSPTLKTHGRILCVRIHEWILRVPAHVCIPANEKADRAAKRGTKGVDSSTVTMKIGLADVYAELTKQAWKQWEKEFHPMATAKEWDDTSSPLQGKSLLPWNSDLPSSHHAPSARGRLEMHVRTDEVWMWDERLVSPRDVLLHFMFRPLPTFDWETTQRGTAPVYEKPGSVRPAWRMEPLAGCSQTGLHLSTGSLPVVGGTTGYVQRFPASRVNPGGGGRGERFRFSRTQF